MDTQTRYDDAHHFDHAVSGHDAGYERTPRARAAREVVPPTTVEYGSGWYHDAAIEASHKMQSHRDF